MFDGTVTTNGSSSYINIPATIHAEGEATLTLDKVNFQLPTGTALTVASGTVTLQNNTYNALLSGTHALRVETGATCLISPPPTQITPWRLQPPSRPSTPKAAAP